MPYVTFADLRGRPLAESEGFMVQIAQGLGRRLPDSDAGMGDVTVIVADQGRDALYEALTQLESRTQAPSVQMAVRKILDNWGQIQVWTEEDMERAGVLRENEPGRPVVNVAAFLAAEAVKGAAAANAATRILTADPSRWWLGGLPETQQEMVEFVLWITQDVAFKAKPADIAEYLKALAVLNIQA